MGTGDSPDPGQQPEQEQHRSDSPTVPRQRSSALAKWALVLALVPLALPPMILAWGLRFPGGPASLVALGLWLVAGVLAVVSLAQRRPGQWMAGVALALILPSLILLVAVEGVVYMRTLPPHPDTVCLSNVNQLALAQLAYASDYDGRFPPAANWVEATWPYIGNESLLVCPWDRRDPKQEDHGRQTSYTMYEPLSGVRAAELPTPAEDVLHFDGTRLFGGRECAEFRHKRALNVGYADGHAAVVREKDFTRQP